MALRYPVDVPVLTDGDTVTLRAHRSGDLTAIIEQCVDADMVRFTTVPRPYGVDDAQQFLRHVRACWEENSPTSTRTWAIAVDVDGDEQFGGTIDYRPTGHGTASVGFGLHPAHRGNGLMYKALGLVLDFAFGADGQDLMEWHAVVGNWPSARTVWRHGFQLEGRVRGLCVQPDGGVYDGWIATLHRDDPRHPRQRWPWPTDRWHE